MQEQKKTYAVLDAILKGHLTIPAIALHTGFTPRCISGLLYALERQSRVIAEDYDIARSQQIFKLLRYESSHYGPRIHPAKAARADREAENLKVVLKDLDQMMFQMMRPHPTNKGLTHN